ncbi:putative mitochondrial outer membrane protein [Nakaseomyces bracarensis]|uniref:Mitochondrial outer membrane protein n=1 Tax=Nakaseomyces bracarensis TaxID=273131 RepID=A0ABR4NSN9_9SACH
MSNPFQNIGKNALYLSAVGVLSVVLVKAVVRSQRDAKYKPEALINGGDPNSDGYYDNLAQVKPGFPIPKRRAQADDEYDLELSDAATTRKSKYEAGGVSAMTRKRGDRLSLFSRNRNNDD